MSILEGDKSWDLGLSVLDPDERDALKAFSQVSRLSANRLIFTQGDRTQHFYLIEQGSVRVFYQSRNGSFFTICQCGKGDLFGLSEAVSLGPRCASARTLEPTLIWAIPSTKLPEVAKRVPKFMLRIVDAMSRRLRLVTIVMESVATQPVSVRAANFLLATAHRSESDDKMVLSQGLTHADIAESIGCARQTLTKVFNMFAQRRLIQIERKRILISDVSALKRYARIEEFVHEDFGATHRREQSMPNNRLRAIRA